MRLRHVPVDEFGYALDRDAQQRHARRYGFYWLPCVLCGFYRGGHEGDEPAIPIEGQTGIYHGVCRRHPNAEREYVYVRAHARALSASSTPEEPDA